MPCFVSSGHISEGQGWKKKWAPAVCGGAPTRTRPRCIYGESVPTLVTSLHFYYTHVIKHTGNYLIIYLTNIHTQMMKSMRMSCLLRSLVRVGGFYSDFTTLTFPSQGGGISRIFCLAMSVNINDLVWVNLDVPLSGWHQKMWEPAHLFLSWVLISISLKNDGSIVAVVTGHVEYKS